MNNRRITIPNRAMHIMLFTVLATSVAVASVQAAQCSQSGLRAPIGYYQPPKSEGSGSYHCEVIPPSVGAMNFTSKYKGSDSARNELNEKAREAYLEASKTVRRLEKEVISSADDYQIDGDGPEARDCVLNNLNGWAQANALLPEDINQVGQAVRKWGLAAAANAYLRVKLISPPDSLDPKKTARIEAWFLQVAKGVRDYYSNRDPKKVNNHDYWAAWAVMVTAVATGNCDDWAWSLQKFDEAMAQITTDGYLPKELSRRDRALEYLNYAMQPLTMMAIFAEVNGVSVPEQDWMAFNKLAQNVVDGLEDPSKIEAITGYPQITKGLYTEWGLAWMRPWTKTWGSLEGMEGFLDEYGPMTSTRLGGDIEFLYRIGPRWTAEYAPHPPKDVHFED